MPACRFYRQGYCRYGNSCRFDHIDNHGYSQEQTNQWGQNSQKNRQSQNAFTSASTTAQVSSLQLKDILKIPHHELLQHLSSDMQNWEQAHMWPTSCCSYWKDGACIPGFDDISPEELRIEAYEAQATGRAHSYKEKVASILKDYHNLRQRYINMSGNDKRSFVGFLEEEKRRVQTCSPYTIVSQESTKTGSAQVPPLFGNTTAVTNASETPHTLFGKPVQPSNMDQSNASNSGKSSNYSGIFGVGSQSSEKSPSSVFRSTEIFNPTSGIPPKNTFGGIETTGTTSTHVNNSTTNILGSTSNTTGSNLSVFGSSANTSGSNVNVFGSNTNTSGSNVNVFGSNTNTSGSNVNVFGSSANTSGSNVNVFGSSANTSGSNVNVFGSNVNNNASSLNVFGSYSTPIVSNPTEPSKLFGKPRPVPANSSPSEANAASLTQSVVTLPDDSVTLKSRDAVYTAMNDLTMAEREQFEATKFSLGRIPTRPPPQELC